MSVYQAASKLGEYTKQGEVKCKCPTGPIAAYFVKKVLAGFAKRHRLELGLPPKSKLYLVLDNASCHKTKIFQQAVRRLHIELLFVPASSPEMNMIERIWWHWKDQLSRLSLQEGAEDRDFRRLARQAWNMLAESTVKALVGKMDERCKTCIKLRGKRFSPKD